MHDDNFDPYYCLPRHFLKQNNFRILFGLKCTATTFTAVEGEAIGFAFLDAIAREVPRNGNDWYDRFSVFTRRGWLVLRTTLVRKDDYLRHTETMRAWDGSSMESDRLQMLADALHSQFWMIEASAPELFASSRRKFGEVLVPCDKLVPTPLNVSFMLATRLPGLVLVRQGGDQVTHHQTSLRSHTPLFTIASG